MRRSYYVMYHRLPHRIRRRIVWASLVSPENPWSRLLPSEPEHPEYAGLARKIEIALFLRQKFGVGARNVHQLAADLREIAPDDNRSFVATRLADSLGENLPTDAIRLAKTATMSHDLYSDKLISHRHRYIFIAVPKVASRSIIRALVKADPSVQLVVKSSLGRVYQRFPESAGYYRFGFVRNPMDRLLSCFRDKIQYSTLSENRFKYIRYVFPNFGVNPADGLDGFCHWLFTPYGAETFSDRHWMSQNRSLMDAQGRLPDFIGCFERLELDWSAVLKEIGLPHVDLPHINASKGPTNGVLPWESDMGLRDALMERYSDDFPLGGYELG